MRSKETTGEKGDRHDTTNRRLILHILLILPISLCSLAHADQVVIAHATVDPSKFPERLVNPGFEETDGWHGWAQGFETVDNGGRNSSRGVKCAGATDTQHGASQLVKLDQEKPRPIIVTGWSRGENVDGSADTGYAIYLDIDYKDGDHLWALTANFSVGTHDWEQRRVTFAPEKPIESLTVHALFRGHNGAVYFDDFSLVELGDDCKMFEGVLTEATMPTPQPRWHSDGTSLHRIVSGDGLELGLDDMTCAFADLMIGEKTLGEVGPPILARDVTADSDFISPNWGVVLSGKTVQMSGVSDQLDLQMDVTVAGRDGWISVLGKVTDLRGLDRAVTVYVPLPVTGEWTSCQDMRRSQPAKGTCISAFRTGVGATGTRSSYPLAVLTGPKGGIALATPINDPRHDRLAYDADRGMLYAAFDIGLTPQTLTSSRAASFRAILFAFDPKWGFRGALDKYYRLFPNAFEKRVKREGLWMAFTDISTIPNPEDFGFAYQEGAPNIAWDEQHDILSFPYTEPMTTWLKLRHEIPRTHDGAMSYLSGLLEKKDDPLHESASIIDASSVHDADGRRVVSVVNAPWCDGCVFALNADPKIPGSLNRGQAELSRLYKAVTDEAPRGLKGWPWRGEGTCGPDITIKHEGQQSLRFDAPAPGKTVDAFQTVDISQLTPKVLIVRGTVRTSDLTGKPDADGSIYVDLVHIDGTPLYCQAIPLEPGTHDFQVVERRIVSDKPFQSATVHLLLRGSHTGTVWFDELFIGEEGINANLLQNGGFEGPLGPGAVADGTYIDSYEFWANTIDYDCEHFSNVGVLDVPLVFDAQSHRVGVLTMFSTFTFQRALAKNMHDAGKLMMANGALTTYDCCAPYCDVLGTETNWMPGGKWQPMTDAELCFRRALSYQKPYCFLMNTHFADFTLELTERYMQRALAYGMFPGFFSENAATDCYFANPKYYEPARPLFKKYIPLIQKIAKAGWEPITLARSDKPEVYVERFGKGSEVYFTVLNDSEKACAANVAFDLDALGMNGKRVIVRELISATDLKLDNEGLVLALKPEQALLLEIVGNN